ncbi:MAG: DUF4011 domain-containing protein [Rugosibacter sp.]|nr:DUF4011 domain-containing protein [Rugosibacter sp.]
MSFGQETVEVNLGEEKFPKGLSVHSGLDKIRKRLLDLTLRNKLLNFYKLSGGRPSGKLLRFIDVSPDDLFEALYIDSNSVEILPVPEPLKKNWEINEAGLAKKPDIRIHAQRCGIDPNFELDESSGHQLQTLVYPEELEATLKKIDQAARLSVEETGTNILHLVFGFLEWYESEESEVALRAPLLILPVLLKRGGVNPETGYFRYSLEYSGEDLVENITLRYKMARGFGLELPPLTEFDTPEMYFLKIAEFAKPRLNWKVRIESCLCMLSFGKLLMYLDLDPSKWPASEELSENFLLKALFEGTDRNKAQSFATEYSIDENIEASAVPIIYDADSSQHSALVDALKGKNLVIEGPPGTGKSQTITNLIASALTSGKSVLFISEKMAALDVVRRNLDRAELGMFCLELHSHKTQKKKLLHDIKLRKEAQFQHPAELGQKLEELEDKRVRLNQYVKTINTVIENRLDKSVHTILWSVERYRSALGDKVNLLGGLALTDATDTTSFDFAKRREAVVQLVKHFEDVADWGAASPWFGYEPHKLLFGDDQTVSHALTDLVTHTISVQSQLSEAEASMAVQLPQTREGAEALIQKISDISLPPGDGAFDLLPDLYSEKNRSELPDFEQWLGFIDKTKVVLVSSFKAFEEVTDADMHMIMRLNTDASELNQHTADTKTLRDRSAKCIKLVQELERALKVLDSAGTSLSIPCVSRTELGTLAKVVSALGSIPLEQMDLVTPLWLEPSAESILTTASIEAAALQHSRQIQSAIFTLPNLPQRGLLDDALGVFTSGGGPFRVFKSEWRRATNLYKRIRVGKKRFWLNSEQCADELRALIEYEDAIDRFEANSEYRRLLGVSYQTIDTDFPRVMPIVKWEARLRKELAGFTGPDSSFSIRGLLATKPETFEWLASIAPEVERQWLYIKDWDSFVSAVFLATSLPPKLNFEYPRQVAKELGLVALRIDESANGLESLFNISVSTADAQELCDALGKYQICVSNVSSSTLPNVLKEYYKNTATNFAPINSTLKWCESVSKACVEFKAWLLDPKALEKFQHLLQLVDSLQSYWSHVDEFRNVLSQFGSFDWGQWTGMDSPTNVQIIDKAEKAFGALNVLMNWADLARAINIVKGYSLGGLVEMAWDKSLEPMQLENAYLYSFYHSIAKSIMLKNPVLMQFSGVTHADIRKRFIELDNQIIKLNGAKCAFSISARTVPKGNGSGPVGTWTEDALLSNEISKQKRHIPIRQLINRAGKALISLKPCFMMGPLSAAQYLEAGKHKFDIVVMDEASQLKPEEALGAIARGNQLIVVGDPKQLPPTSFFDKITTEGTGDPDEDSAVEEAESILDVCSLIFQPVHRLRWHYRSQHHSLIAFSNRHFYNERPLIIFPSPHGHSNGLGIRNHYFSDGLYEGHRNKVEAVKVADAVITHFRSFPEHSLGVVTLNLSQRDLIEEEIDRRLKVYPQAQDYLTQWQDKGYPFFIKNLENVQGDERDVIYISTTHGRRPDGRFVMQFGPINKDQGWRRLNVLFTRAKKRVEVFTSMSPSDIRIDGNTPRGVQALKDYLVYARDGLLEAPEITGKPFDSEFEISVAGMLTNKGYEVVPQLGVAGFFIDLAVRHPTRPGDFLACIECDGATYHSGLSVRDRDRLRQEVLERLGWEGKIYRIWSTDWFKDPNRQLEKLLTFLSRLVDLSPPLAVVAKGAPEVWEQAKVIATSGLEIEVGDFVSYCFVDNESHEMSVQIVSRASDPNDGLVNQDTPLAKALLGLCVGDEEEVKLPLGNKILRVLDIQR